MTNGKVVALYPAARHVGGFDAGTHGRRLRAIPAHAGAINATIRNYGRTALARSRHLCTNNPYMANAKEEFIAALVGDGIKPSFVTENEDVKRELQETFLEWTDEADADGLTDFYGVQGLAASEMFEAGEVFIRVRPRFLSDGLSVPMQMQLLPSEMCPLYYNISLGNNRKIECGVQFNAIGQREGYWFFRNHPGELQYNTVPADVLYFVPADQILHLFKPIRAGQIRGIPHTLAGIVTAAIHDLYEDAELERKRTAALFSAFITRNANEEDGENPLGGAPTKPHDHTTGQQNVGMEPGATVELTAGQQVSFAQPADVGGNFEVFEYRMALKTAAGVGVPYMKMTGDLRAANYGSQRGGDLTFKRRISMIQNSVMIFQFCRPILQRWLQAGITGKSFSTFSATQYAGDPKSFGGKVRWITPKWDWIDPLKDLSAEKLAVDSGFKARSDVIEATGEDPHEVDARIKADQDRAEELGLEFKQVSTGIVVSPTSEVDPVPAPNSGLEPNPQGGNYPENSPTPKGPRQPPKARRNAPARYSWDR
jgi:lambda family phage portal protein